MFTTHEGWEPVYNRDMSDKTWRTYEYVALEGVTLNGNAILPRDFNSEGRLVLR